MKRLSGCRKVGDATACSRYSVAATPRSFRHTGNPALDVGPDAFMLVGRGLRFVELQAISHGLQVVALHVYLRCYLTCAECCMRKKNIPNTLNTLEHQADPSGTANSASNAVRRAASGLESPSD